MITFPLIGTKAKTEDKLSFVGDDFEPGGNDEHVYRSDVPFIQVLDYRRYRESVGAWL